MTDLKPISQPHDDNARLREQLRALAVDAPDSGFRSALHQRLASEPAPSPVSLYDRATAWLRGRRAWLWPVGGLVAGVASYALLVVVHGNPLATPAAPPMLILTAPGAPAPPAVASGPSGPILPSFRVPASKVAVIKLAFAAEVAVEDVTFEVTLPEGLAFWSRGQRLDERTFRWPGRLDAGENLIPIAVRGDHPGRYPVVATVEIGGRVLEQRVVMDVQEEGT